MSIASEITRINNNIASAYTACNGKGATMPATQNSANLATCINSIPSETPTTGYVIVEIPSISNFDTTGTSWQGYDFAIQPSQVITHFYNESMPLKLFFNNGILEFGFFSDGFIVNTCFNRLITVGTEVILESGGVSTGSGTLTLSMGASVDEGDCAAYETIFFDW